MEEPGEAIKPCQISAIAYYLDNRKQVEDFFAHVDREFQRRVRPLSAQDPNCLHGSRQPASNCVRSGLTIFAFACGSSNLSARDCVY
jgi:hypothetical protein